MPLRHGTCHHCTWPSPEAGITPSRRDGRYGWNSVDWTGPVPDDEVRELTDASYDAALTALPKSRRPG
ncbi:hypothetical protein [Blastococcus brunescens]|uniref:Uncharacterized protein n=1 Tax=Blastococcus brunescens TaxID=1564165 RepID=A0ABZ1ATN7_9ACTN|nr:hypothetical protein [Blastococcus sp. BMG 8361]WRL61944.1 hypothetical protein U6N30_17800 [Blastococcus sp. BMG 8361]